MSDTRPGMQRLGPREDVLCAVLLGNATTSERAEAIARNSRRCPYVTLYVAKERVVVGVFAIPASKRWWIEYPQTHPELLGLETAVVQVTERIHASSPWSRGDLAPVLSVAPCGTPCDECPQYRARCGGCPATIYYLRD